MFADLAHGAALTIWHTWQALTVPPSRRPHSRHYRPQYWEADLAHQATVPPTALRRDWQGRRD